MSRLFYLKRVLIASTLILGLGMFAGCASTSGSSSPELEKAKKLIEQGNYEEAFMQLNHALAEAPKDPNVHLNLGWLYLYTDDPAHAEQELAKVEELSPGMAEAYHLRGSLFNNKAQKDKDNAELARKDQEEAVENFKKALDKDDKNYQTYFDLANSLTALDKNEDALNALDKGFDYIPNNDLDTQVNFQIASCTAHAKLQMYDEAIADCKQAQEFSTNPASKQRIEDMIQNLQLMNPSQETQNAESGQ